MLSLQMFPMISKGQTMQALCIYWLLFFRVIWQCVTKSMPKHSVCSTTNDKFGLEHFILPAGARRDSEPKLYRSPSWWACISGCVVGSMMTVTSTPEGLVYAQNLVSPGSCCTSVRRCYISLCFRTCVTLIIDLSAVWEAMSAATAAALHRRVNETVFHEDSSKPVCSPLALSLCFFELCLTF